MYGDKCWETAPGKDGVNSAVLVCAHLRSFVRSFYMMGFGDVRTDNSVSATPALFIAKHIRLPTQVELSN